ncbi:MAG: hypothetical protein QXE76_06250 [Candidatus Bathyarchaeia archaeon]
MKISLNSFVDFLYRSKKTILLVIFTVSITLIISTLVSLWLSRFHNVNFPSVGTIRTEGVDAYGGDIKTLSDGTKQLDWGIVYPGSVIQRSFYVKSKSNIEIILNFTRGETIFRNSKNQVVALPQWDKPPLYIVPDYADSPLKPGEVIFVTLSLHVSSEISFIDYLVDNDVQSFSFDIYISPKK